MAEKNITDMTLSMASLRLSSWRTYHVYTHAIPPKDRVGGVIEGGGDGLSRQSY